MLRRKLAITSKITEPEYAVVSDIATTPAKAVSNDSECKMDVNLCYSMAKVEGIYEEIDETMKKNDAYGLQQ